MMSFSEQQTRKYSCKNRSVRPAASNRRDTAPESATRRRSFVEHRAEEIARREFAEIEVVRRRRRPEPQGIDAVLPP